MQARITITITDTAKEGDIPERVIQASAPMMLELDNDTDDFVATLENLVTQNLSQTLRRLVTKVNADTDAYIARMKAEGLTQPQLPLGDIGCVGPSDAGIGQER